MIETISPSQTYRHIINGEAAALIDVRTPGEFMSLHAVGARCIPLDQINGTVLLQEEVEEGARKIYLICQAGKRARMAAEKLEKEGVIGAVVVEGGTEAWVNAGLPCESDGGGVISLERQVRIAAGLLVVTGVVLAGMVHPDFIWLSALVGAGLIFAGITDFCGMGMLLAKMPWNRGR